MPKDLRANQGKTVAAAPANDWRPALSHLTAAGRYSEATELIERSWDEAPLRGAYGALALAVLAREGRFDLLDRLAARGEGSRGPVLRNEIAYQLGLLSVSTKVQPAFAELFADAGSRIAERTLVDLRGPFEAGREQAVWLRSALVDTLALCLVGARRPAEALAQLELLDETGLSNPERRAVACTRAMALAIGGDRKAARAARGEAGALGADQRLMDAADGVITSRRLPKVDVGDPRGWTGLAIACSVFGWLTASVGQEASSVQTGFAVAAVVAIPLLSLAVHELVHVLAARAQGLRVLAVRFNGTRAQTRVAMPLGLPPKPIWVLAPLPLTAALAALGGVGLASPPSLWLTPSLWRMIALWLLLINAGGLASSLSPAVGKHKIDGDLVSAWKRYRGRRAWLWRIGPHR